MKLAQDRIEHHPRHKDSKGNLTAIEGEMMNPHDKLKLAFDYNPYHDERGMFTSGEAGGGKGVSSVGLGNKAAVEKMKAEYAAKEGAHKDKVSGKAEKKGEKSKIAELKKASELSKASELKKAMEKPKEPEPIAKTKLSIGGGSEKQNDWAKTIAGNWVNEMDRHVAETLKRDTTNDPQIAQYKNDIQIARNKLVDKLNNAGSRFIIDNRYTNPTKTFRNIAERNIGYQPYTEHNFGDHFGAVTEAGQGGEEE